MGVLLVALTAVGFAPPPHARADWTDFLPKPFENGAFLDLYAAYERDHIHSGAASNRWTDSYIREKLTLFSDGYSYHPRFVRYRFSISGALKQEDYGSSVIDTPGWQNDTGLEYDTWLLFLPEHVYNLTVYAARFEPLFKEQVATEHGSVESTRGVSFRYRKKPYFLHTGYGNDHLESGLTSSDVTRFFLDGEYFKRFTGGNEVSFNGAFNPSWFNATGGVDGSTYQYLVGNTVNLQRARLTSNLSRLESDQQDGSRRSFKNDQLALYELFTAYLPWNFRSDVKYFYQNNDGRIDEPGDVTDRTLSATSNDVQLDVYHRLYESLDTTYSFIDSRRDSSGGETTYQSNGLALNYSKTIPWGRFNAGTHAARGETDSQGQADIPIEAHPGIAWPVPGSFALRQPNVVEGSVAVYINCPAQDPSPCPETVIGRIPLARAPCENQVEGCYELIADPARNSFIVQVILLPLDFVADTYEFLVSYSTQGDFNLRTDTYGVSTSVQLFDDLLTPYFSYVGVRSHVLSGEFPGVPLDSTTYTTGLLVQRGPLRARGEYQDFQWEAAPYQSWLAEVQYVSAISPSTSVYSAVSYLNKHYSQGTIVYYANVTDYTEESVTSSGNIQHRFAWPNIVLSAGGSYSHINSLVDTNAYSATASVLWQIGKVDLSVGARVYGSDSSGLNSGSTERDHELFYVKFRRRLF